MEEKGSFAPCTREKGLFAPCIGGKRFVCSMHGRKGLVCSEHGAKEGTACPGLGWAAGAATALQKGRLPGDPMGPRSLLPTLPPRSALPLIFQRGNRQPCYYFFLIFFMFVFFPPRSHVSWRSPAGGQRCRVPSGARCRRGGAGGARRPWRDNGGDSPRRSRPYCVSEEEMDEGHILPLFRCPAPGKSCAL